jgi:hypothetical protein
LSYREVIKTSKGELRRKFGDGVREDGKLLDDDMAEGVGYGFSYGTPLSEQESIIQTIG